MLGRLKLTVRDGKFVIINPTGPFSRNNSMISFLDLDTSFSIFGNDESMSYRARENFVFCIPEFNAGCVPLRCSVQVLGHERRVITGNLLITDTDSILYGLPRSQKIQLAISESINGEKYQKIITVNSIFDLLYPFKIEKPFISVEIKDYANHPFCTGEPREIGTISKKSGHYVKPEPVYKRIQRPNQVWDISQNMWITVPKPRPRDRAWSWDNTLSWNCPKNKETGELMEQDRTEMTDCWPSKDMCRVATYHSKKKDR